MAKHGLWLHAATARRGPAQRHRNVTAPHTTSDTRKSPGPM